MTGCENVWTKEMKPMPAGNKRTKELIRLEFVNIFVQRIKIEIVEDINKL